MASENATELHENVAGDRNGTNNSTQVNIGVQGDF